jgi:hypothetical protein
VGHGCAVNPVNQVIKGESSQPNGNPASIKLAKKQKSKKQQTKSKNSIYLVLKF